jgi:hypothetical protein
MLSRARLNVRSPILTKSRRFHVCSEHGTRWGHDMVYRIGSRMSGHPSCITAECSVSLCQATRYHTRITHTACMTTASSFLQQVPQQCILLKHRQNAGALTHLRQDGRVLCLHHGVDDALRMDNNLDVVV